MYYSKKTLKGLHKGLEFGVWGLNSLSRVISGSVSGAITGDTRRSLDHSSNEVRIYGLGVPFWRFRNGERYF